MKLDRKTLVFITIAAVIVGLAVKYGDNIIYGLLIILSVIKPVILGFCFAYVLNIIISFYERKILNKILKEKQKKSKRLISIIMTFATIIILVIIVAQIIVPQLISALGQLLTSIPVLLQNIQKIAAEYPDTLGFVSDKLSEIDISFDEDGVLQTIYAWGQSGGIGLVKNLGGYLVSFFTETVNVVLAIFISIYVLAGKEKLKMQFNKLTQNYLKSKYREKLYYFLNIANSSFRSFFIGQCIEAVIIGALCAIGLFILRIPYAGMIGVLVGSTALIPIAGAYIGTIVGVIIISTESPFKALVFVIYLLILQQLEGQLIYPKVVGTSIGLPGIWVLVSVIVGGGLLGIPGIIVGIPITSIIYRLIKNDVAAKEKKQQKEEHDKILENSNT